MDSPNPSIHQLLPSSPARDPKIARAHLPRSLPNRGAQSFDPSFRQHRGSTNSRKKARRKDMAAVMVARQGRELQRYSDSTGGRIVVGCVAYRVREDDGGVEVLVISSQKKGAAGGVLLPKGGWELDESMEQAARREAMEEAGVAGEVAGPPLGVWWYRSRSYDATYEGIVLPLRVTREMERWPEMAARRREWVSVAEAVARCHHGWMREALQRFAERHAAEAAARIGSAL